MANIKTMQAKYRGKCMFCGEYFEAGDTFQWHIPSRLGYHTYCPVENKVGQKRIERKDISDIAVKTVQAEAQIVPQLAQLFDGRFTIPFKKDDNDRLRHVTLWITTRSAKHHFAGSRRIRLMHGRRNERDYIDIAYITPSGELRFINDFFLDPMMHPQKKQVAKKAVEILVTGNEQVEYGMYFALISRKCFRCGRVLTNPETLKLQSGCGPVCDKFFEEKGIDITKIPTPKTQKFVLD